MMRTILFGITAVFLSSCYSCNCSGCIRILDVLAQKPNVLQNIRGARSLYTNNGCKVQVEDPRQIFKNIPTEMAQAFKQKGHQVSFVREANSTGGADSLVIKTKILKDSEFNPKFCRVKVALALPGSKGGAEEIEIFDKVVQDFRFSGGAGCETQASHEIAALVMKGLPHLPSCNEIAAIDKTLEKMIPSGVPAGFFKSFLGEGHPADAAASNDRTAPQRSGGVQEESVTRSVAAGDAS